MMYMSPETANHREQIVFGKDYTEESYKYGGIQHFNKLDITKAKQLLKFGYLDPDDAQNASPTAQEFIDFCDCYEGEYYLHGYVVSPERDDHRITIEGIGSYDPLTDEEMLDFLKTFRFADEIYVDFGEPAYCWYD